MKTTCQLNHFTVLKSISAVVLLVLLISCGEDDPASQQQLSGMVMGTVQDEEGNFYPNTKLSLTKGSEIQRGLTDSQGRFDLTTRDIGTYEITIVPPLSTIPITNSPSNVNVQDNQTSTFDFLLEAQQPVIAHLNIGSVDLLGEIKDQDGLAPTDLNVLLYASNVYDEPIGKLTAITAPDDHHISLSEWETATGNVMVNCNGDASTVHIVLEGMIPNGTYTFWLAYLNKTKQVGQSIDFANDPVNSVNPPLGSGTEKEEVAGPNGTINETIQHSSCILTDEVALVIPVVYHINGNTYGTNHIPDDEEVAHMLVYFQ
jgi:hypothetical protein